MTTLLINDVHLGVKRSGGTTLKSRAALGDYLHRSLASLLADHDGMDVVVVGDLFDGFEVDGLDLIRTYGTFADWLHGYGTGSTNHNLTLIAGNHDYQPKAGRVSSFHMLCHFLKSRFGDRVRVIDHNTGFAQVRDDVWAIPHMPNQALFDMEIERAIASGAKGYLLLHCNLMSTFAENSDHSLNLSDAQVRALSRFSLVLGHEHQGRDVVVGGTCVTVIGNQFPSSVIDCLPHGAAQRDGTKRAMLIRDDLTCDFENTWDALGSYCAVDWRTLDQPIVAGLQFIRVEGEATVEEAADVVNAIAKFRSNSDAFVVTNAVRIAGVAGMDDLAEMSLDQIQQFDVLQALLDILDEREAAVVKGLMNAQ